MKTIVPFKYTIGMLCAFDILPAVLLVAVNLSPIMSKVAIRLSYLFLAFILLGPLVFFLNLRNSSIIIRNGLLTNNISDGTRNYGWTEEMCYIRKAEAVTQLQVHSYYRSFPGKKAILIDFGKGNIKYIAADLFSKRQIKAILNILNSTI